MKRTLLTALLLGPLSALHAADAPVKKPNIIVILADDLGYGDVQCYNPQRGKWHVGLTFFDKDGQPIRGNGVEAVQRVNELQAIRTDLRKDDLTTLPEDLKAAKE